MTSRHQLRIICLIGIFLSAACCLHAQQIKVTSASNPMNLKADDLVDFRRLTPENIRQATDDYVAAVKASNKHILDVPAGKRNFANTLGELDNGADFLIKGTSVFEALFSAHPDKDIRDAATAGYQTLSSLQGEQNLNEELYKAVKAYALTPEAKALTGERKYFLHITLRDFERNGLSLSPEKRDSLKLINNKLLEYTLAFGNNIAQDNPTITFTEAEMEGTPDDFKKERRQADGIYKLDASNPSYMPFMTNARSADARKRYYMLKMNVGASKNEKLLADIIRLRIQKVKLLGYATYSDYATESVMARNKQRVTDFENQLKKDVREKAEKDYKDLLEFKTLEEGKPATTIYPYDIYYYTNQLLDKRYKVDAEKVKAYFELQNVIKGLFTVYQRIYNVSFVEDQHPNTWHPDVQAFTVVDNSTKKNIGYFYLDLYPRDNKYKHAGCFSLIPSRTVAGGRQLASAALICNFPKPTADQPSLLTHPTVQTLFHEFGHLMHVMVSETEFCSFAGTNVVTDFVEAPSQIMENWVWNKEVLALFAKHYKTGEVIPGDLVDKMIASKNATSGLTTLQQVFYGTLDFTLNNGFVPKTDNDIPDLVKQLQNSITLYPYIDGSHFEASFGHLTGYASEYYGYLWSQVYAQDMFSVFEHRGLLNQEAGYLFRKTVLAKGGSVDALTLVSNFLGREPNNKAFLKNLGLGGK
jgi:thimet oligopeptidase